MNKLKYLLFALFLFVPLSVNANSISNIDMDIVVDDAGTATITETWSANVSQGTEGWHPYFNLGASEITVVSASMDGTEYQIKESWNENASLSEKAYKAGVYKVDSNEVDIVFGISSYGSHKYQVVYKITHFVSTLEDSDMLFWQLFPYDFSAEPGNVSIKVTGPSFFKENEVDVWSYGMYGSLCYVNNGAIYLTSEGRISTSEYLTLLAKFPKGTFKDAASLDNNFDYYFQKAEEGAEHYVNKDKKDFSEIVGAIIEMLIYVGIPALFIIFGAKAAKSAKYGYKDNKTIDKKEVPNFRDIPCNKDIYYANALIKVNEFGYREGNILGAIILKWIKENKITFINEKKGIFNKDTSSIDLTKDNTFDNSSEEKLFGMMRAASGDGILEAKELEKWCKKNYSKYLDLFKSITNDEISRLKTENHIYTRTSKEECKYKNVMDDTIYKDSTELYGLKKFLDEFSRMNEKEAIEVKMWDEYLMFAYLFGIADKVAKQLKDLYPEQVQELENRGIDIGTIYYINHISTASVSAASAARAAAESYSGGGGGFGSGGGGGGSFGGGGGGGGFR